MNKVFPLLLFCLVSFFSLDAQIELPNRNQALKELQKRGITEEEFKARMLERGYDIDNIDPLSTNLAALQTEVEQVILELEQEKAIETLEEDIVEAQDTLKEIQQDSVEQVADETSKASAERIRQLVNQGIPLEEAIAIELVESSTTSLPDAKIYGQHIFRNKDIAVYNSAVDIRPPDNYILGVGDKITILIWGASLENATFEINKAGFIQPTGMQRINLKGVSYQKARDLLRRRFQERYRFRPEEFEVTIDNARTITVNILGEAIQTGSFNLPALNTAFNALAAAQGPTDIGSVRNIKLIRADGTSQTVDIYKYLLNPTQVEDFFLLNNDYIFIPVAEKTITIEGAVNRPFIYELTSGEGLKKLIEYAGGLKDNALQSIVQIKRFEADEEIILDVNLRELNQSGRDFELQKGDVVSIREIAKAYDNFADITGAIDLPGQYEITTGMRITDLIQKAILSKEARKDKAFLQRRNLDNSVQYIRLDINELLSNPNSDQNVQLQSKDKIVILSLENYTDDLTFSVSGAVRQPNTHPFDPDENLTVEDALIIAGGTLPEATDFAYIYRKDAENRRLQQYVPINIKAINENPNSSENIRLQPYDSLVVYRFNEFIDNAFIDVQGAVRKPGRFKYDVSLNLKDALLLTKGLKLEASLSRIDISRLIINEDETKTDIITLEVDEDFNLIDGTTFQLMPYDIINVRKAPEFEFQKTIILKGEVKYPGKYSLINDNEPIAQLIERAGGLTDEAFASGSTLYRTAESVGYIVMDLEEAMKKDNSIYNYILKDGDIIEIPKQKDFVSINGATKAKEVYPDKILRTGRLNVPYHGGKNAKWYVDNYAAGIGEYGRRRLITVEHPNGQIEKSRFFGLFMSYPEVQKGSIITVGRIAEKEIREDNEREDVDWGKVLADSVAQATAILTLILLIESR